MNNILQLQTLTTPEEYYEVGVELENALQMQRGNMFFESFQKEGAEVMVLRREDKTLLALSVRIKEDGSRFVNHVVGHANRRPTEQELKSLGGMLEILNIGLEYDPHTPS